MNFWGRLAAIRSPPRAPFSQHGELLRQRRHSGSDHRPDATCALPPTRDPDCSNATTPSPSLHADRIQSPATLIATDRTSYRDHREVLRRYFILRALVSLPPLAALSTFPPSTCALTDLNPRELVASKYIYSTASMAPGTLQEAISRLESLDSDIARYLFLRDLREENEDAFYALLVEHAQDILPYVYTPTVGEACEKYSHLPVKTRGIFFTPADKGQILQKLQAWPGKDVKVMVVTDGERILGLGDLGYGGMGISEGKILLYTAIGGVSPQHCLPLCLDFGTENEELLKDPEYKGLRQRRLRGTEYYELLDEFMTAVRTWQPRALLQFEDFANSNAFRLLEKYRNVQCCFNDDIQGTACITLAGLLSALRVTGGELGQQKIMFLGAGEAGTGIAQLIVQAMRRRSGLSEAEARTRCIFLDSRGLVCASRPDKLAAHKQPFAHAIPFQPDLLSAVNAERPTMLIGVSTQAGAFTQEVLEAMAEINERPIVFPLSNPTSKSECTFEDAFAATRGTVVFASGSPFPPFSTPDGRRLFPAQSNNAYVFGPIGMAAVITECRTISDGVFLETAEALARRTPAAAFSSGMLFPSFSDMKEVAPLLIADVAKFMVEEGLGRIPEAVATKGWEGAVLDAMYRPPPFPSSTSYSSSSFSKPTQNGFPLPSLAKF